MDYSRMGKTGLEVSRICFGCMSFGKVTEERPWVLGVDEARPIFRKAWESGIKFFDTANVYAAGTSEELTGTLLKELAPRDEIVLATKVFGRMRPGPNGQGLSRKAILSEIDNSLTRLDVDYVDLYQIHRFDPFTPYEETMDALDEVVKSGKARYIGASSMWAWQFAKYQRAAELNGGTQFVSMQNQVSLTYREEEHEMLPLCKADGIGVLPWSPLGGGKLTRPWGQETKRNTTDRYNK
jgi:1-deoxyxylulose-5-phosphate synthase